MKCGVVYKFKPHNKLNGTLFYCFEYFRFLKKYIDVKFYIVGITDKELDLVRSIFAQKYTAPLDDIIPVKKTDLYSLKLDRTLILDVNTFYDVKEFLTNEIHCFSNETHEMFRYKNDRQVTYYGSYPSYQRYDVFCYLKLNFDIFQPLKQEGNGVFISALNQKFVRLNIDRWEKKFNRPITIKKSHSGHGNIFDMIDTVLYVHTERDTNNRIIPEGFFYNKQVIVEEPWYTDVDSIMLRYFDIKENGLGNYTLTEQDEMVKACLR